MNSAMGLVVLTLHLTAGAYSAHAAASPVSETATAREAQPAPSTPTREQLESALLEIGAERDALRLALRAAQDEIARSRAAQDAQAGILAETNAALSSCLSIGEELKISVDTYDALLTAERKAGKKQRFATAFKFSLLGAASGYLAAELTK